VPVALSEHNELTRSLVSRELRGQYKRSALGWFWSLLNPLAMVATYAIVFSLVFRAAPPVGDPSGRHSYVLFLITGLIPWNLFAGGLNGSAASLVDQASLISKVYFPRAAVVLAKLGALAVSSAIEFAVVVVVLVVSGNFVLPWLGVLAGLFALQLALVLGLGLMLSVTNAYFRDVQYLLGIGLQVVFYLTPIIYPPSFVREQVGDRLYFLYRLNPLERLVESYRNVLYDMRFPALADVGYVALWAAAMLFVGYRVFRRLEPRLAEEL